MVVNDMSRLNGTFRYKNAQEPERDPVTGFLVEGEAGDWADGGRCQIGKSVPAQHVVSADGDEHTYTYDMFVPRPWHGGDLRIGTEVEVTMEDGSTDFFTAQGVDNLNRRYIEIWG